MKKEHFVSLVLIDEFLRSNYFGAFLNYFPRNSLEWLWKNFSTSQFVTCLRKGRAPYCFCEVKTINEALYKLQLIILILHRWIVITIEKSFNWMQFINEYLKKNTKIIYSYFRKLIELNILASIKCRLDGKLLLSFSGAFDKCPDVVFSKRDSREGIFSLHCA